MDYPIVWSGLVGKRVPWTGKQVDERDVLGISKLEPGRMTLREETSQCLGCPACDRIGQQRVWLIRCHRCAEKHRLTAFAGCDRCGGEAWARRQFEGHLEDAHEPEPEPEQAQ
jgi:hypothetical protein